MWLKFGRITPLDDGPKEYCINFGRLSQCGILRKKNSKIGRNSGLARCLTRARTNTTKKTISLTTTQLWLYAIDHVRSADGGWSVIVGFYESLSTTGFIDLIDHGLHTLLMSMTMCRLQQMAHRSSVVSVQVKADRLWPWLSERPTLIPKPIGLPLRYATRKDLEWTTHIWRLTKLVVVYSKQWMSSIMDAKCQQRTL